MSGLTQTETWQGQRLEDMSLSHQVNTLAFLRRRAKTFQFSESMRYFTSSLAGVDDPSDGVWAAQLEAEAEFDRPAEEWIEDQPLVRRLVELTSGTSKARLLSIKARNRAYEIATGYRPS